MGELPMICIISGYDRRHIFLDEESLYLDTDHFSLTNNRLVGKGGRGL